MVADGVACLDDLFHPVDVLLFEYLAHHERLDDATFGLDAAAGFDGVLFGGLVEVALFVVPVHHVPGGIVPRHFQIEGDGDEGLVVVRGRVGLGLTAVECLGRSESDAGRRRAGHESSPRNGVGIVGHGGASFWVFDGLDLRESDAGPEGLRGLGV